MAGQRELEEFAGGGGCEREALCGAWLVLARRVDGGELQQGAAQGVVVHAAVEGREGDGGGEGLARDGQVGGGGGDGRLCVGGGAKEWGGGGVHKGQE